jgi:hypothetical protein
MTFTDLLIITFQLDTLDGALPGLPFAFICDSRGTGGLGEIDIDVTHEGR